MAKNEKTTIWILGIAVALLLLIQFSNVYDGGAPFAILGGGAGSSITQIIWSTTETIYDNGESMGDEERWCVVRPPVGETWLITDMEKDESGVLSWCFLVQGEVIDWSYMVNVLTTDRLFIDSNTYLACGDCGQIVISGVRA